MTCKNGHAVIVENRATSTKGEICRLCRNEAANRFYKRNRERILMAMREAYIADPEPRRVAQRERYAANPERYGAISRKWAEENPEKARDTDRRWNHDNVDRVRASRVRWTERNPDHQKTIVRQSCAKRRAIKLDAFVEHVDALVVLESDDGLCGICYRDVDPFDFQVDHIIPLSRGGQHAYFNVQVAHASCNNRKHSRLPEECEGLFL